MPLLAVRMLSFRSLVCSLALLGAMLALSGCGVRSLVRQQQAAEAMRIGDYATAEQQLKAVVAGNPGNWETRLQLARVQLALDKPLDAQLNAEQALVMHPVDDRRQPGQHELAGPAFDAGGKFPDTADIYDVLAEALYRQGLRSQLLTVLQQRATKVQTVRDYLRLAKYQSLVGDNDGADIALRKARNIAPVTDLTPYLQAARHYADIGDVASAKTALYQAYFIAPDNAEVNERLRGYGVIPGPSIALPPGQLPADSQ